MKKLLLHSCCGPCSTAVIDKLLKETDYLIDVYYYNPNIHPEAEYIKRKGEQIKFIKLLNNDRVNFIDADYDPDNYFKLTNGLESEKEGGERCSICFELRLSKTALYAKTNGYDIFGTTLTVSPHKNATVINEIGQRISKTKGIDYLVADFKKQDGFKKSITLAKDYGLYRQNYCACVYSNWNIK